MSKRAGWVNMGDFVYIAPKPDAMLDKEKIMKMLLENRSELETFGVKRIGIFGSFVRNEQRPDSDIDFWVEYKPGRKSFQNYMQLAFWLEDIFQRKIDLITPESISKHIAPYVEKELEYVQQTQTS